MVPGAAAATRSFTTSTAATGPVDTLRGIDEQVRKAEQAVAGSCSQRWRSAGGSSTSLAGPSASSSKQPAATGPSRSRPAHVLTAADPLPSELRQAIEAIHASR